jgi:hypothetical protein
MLDLFQELSDNDILTATNVDYVISSFDDSYLASETVLSYFQNRSDTILKHKVENKEFINLKDICKTSYTFFKFC